MIAPSLPIVLFAVADAIARRGLPDPERVEVRVLRGEIRLDLHLATADDLREWAKHCGAQAERWIRETPYETASGEPRTIVTTHGSFAGVYTCLTAVVPAEGREVAE